MNNIRNKASMIAAKTTAALSGLMFSAMALAQTEDLSSGFSAEWTAHKPELYALGGLILGACAVGFIIARARRQTGG